MTEPESERESLRCKLRHKNTVESLKVILSRLLALKVSTLGSSKLITCLRIFLPYILRNEKNIYFSVTTWPHIVVVYFVHTQPVNMVVLVQRL